MVGVINPGPLARLLASRAMRVQSLPGRAAASILLGMGRMGMPCRRIVEQSCVKDRRGASP